MPELSVFRSVDWDFLKKGYTQLASYAVIDYLPNASLRNWGQKMEKSFFDICYELLSHYLHFPDVADTYKSINDGLYYKAIFPQRIGDYSLRSEIISYIEKVRTKNIIDAYREKENPFALIPVPTGKLLSESSAEELYSNLVNERFQDLF